MVDSLNGNTTDVTAAVGSLFGEPAASQFMSLWADHLDLLGTYAADVGAEKQNRRQAVQDDLHNWQQRFAAFIDTATQSRVPAPDLAAALLGLRRPAAAAGRRLRRPRLSAGPAADQPDLPAGVRARAEHGRRLRGDARGPDAAGRREDRCRWDGDRPRAAGRGTPAGRRAPATFRSVRTYQEVAPPVRLRIPAVRIDTPLQRLGRAADATVEVPGDFGVAGWFADGPRPGQDGPAVILGHVDSRTGPGVFYPLAGLAAGTEVLVDRADGSTVTFRVSGVVTVPKSGFPTDQVYGPTLQSSLRLVTCGGPFDRAAGSYRDNVIVSADPVV